MILSLCGFVALWFLLRDISCRVLFCSLSSCFFFLFFFSVPFSTVITSLGEERPLVYVLLVHLFIHFTNVHFCHFSLPLGVRD